MRLPRRLQVDPTSGSRIPGVEGLRAVAAGSILVFHCWLDSSPDGSRAELGPLGRYLLPHLPLGVTLFFTLSGFLLYRPFAAALLRERERPSIGRYLRNRALRILPAYWAILAVVALVLETALVYDENGHLTPGRLDDPGILARDALFLQNYTDPWSGSFFTGIGPAWSLAIEAVFYLALPLLVLVAFALTARVSRLAAALAPAAILLLIGLGGKATIYALGVTPWAVAEGNPASTILTWSFVGNADKFSFGVALAVLSVAVADGRVTLPRWWASAAVAALVAVAAPAAAFTANNADDPQPSNLAYNTLTALACAILVALVVLPGQRRRGRAATLRLLETPPVVAVGLVSYSLFLWHEPLVYWLRREGLTLAGSAGFAFNLGLLAVAALALSALTYRWIELPALRRKRSTAAAGDRVPAQEAQAAP